LLSPFRKFVSPPPGHTEVLLGVGEEALGRVERLPVGAVQPQLLGHAYPDGALGGESLEPGKRLAARGDARDVELVQACPWETRERATRSRDSRTSKATPIESLTYPSRRARCAAPSRVVW
jgi:hypothetical protein